MVMVIEVDVEELWRKAVATTPIIRPHIGFSMRGLLKAPPAERPGSREYSSEVDARISML